MWTWSSKLNVNLKFKVECELEVHSWMWTSTKFKFECELHCRDLEFNGENEFNFDGESEVQVQKLLVNLNFKYTHGRPLRIFFRRCALARKSRQSRRGLWMCSSQSDVHKFKFNISAKSAHLQPLSCQAEMQSNSRFRFQLLKRPLSHRNAIETSISISALHFRNDWEM